MRCSSVATQSYNVITFINQKVAQRISRNIEQVQVDVTKPLERYTKQQAYTCRRCQETFACTKYFFGATDCLKVSQEYLTVGTAECLLMERTHQSKEGPLIPTGDNTLETQNQLKPIYLWPRTNMLIVSNTILAYTSVIADTKQGTVSHIHLQNLNCRERDGIITCEQAGWSLLTPRVEVGKCVSPKTKNRTTLQIFKLDEGLLYKISQDNLIFSKLVKCDETTLSCIVSEYFSLYR